jgi:hypothetical protein
MNLNRRLQIFYEKKKAKEQGRKHEMRRKRIMIFVSNVLKKFFRPYPLSNPISSSFLVHFE